MGVDLRQVVAGILTLTMFVMLGQMIKRDHFDSLQDKLPGDGEDAHFESVNAIENDGLVKLSKRSKGPWMEDIQELKPCWSRTDLDEIEQSRGYVTFSLTNGPEYHVSQIADAVVVARYLTAASPDRSCCPWGKSWHAFDLGKACNQRNEEGRAEKT